MELRDRVVVVTGAGSGIGEAIAVAAVHEGARHVVVADLDAANAARVAGSLGTSASAVGIDVRNEEAIRTLVERVENEHGPIDLFVSNAGFVTTAGLEDSNDRIQSMFDVHVMAHIYAARAVLPSMISRGEGYLLNTASAAGLLTQIGSLSYSITKHAAVALAEWLAITHHHQGIRVSVLCPQAVATNIVMNSPDRLASGDESDPLGTGVAGGDGVRTAAEVAQACIDTIRAETFHVLPHAEVKTYVERKATDIDRWLGGMRRMQTMLYPEGPLPGDAIAPKLS